MIALTILSLISASIGIKINQAVREKRFQASVECLKNKLKTAFCLAKLTQEHVDLILEKKDGVFIIKIRAKTHLKEHIIRSFKKQDKLEEVQDIAFDDSSFSSLGKEKQVVHVYPIGIIDYSDSIKITSYDQSREATVIELSNYSIKNDPNLAIGYEIFPHEVLSEDEEELHSD